MKLQLMAMVLLLIYSVTVSAGSIRCRGALVKIGDSSNQLIKKCGQPSSKFSSKASIREQGRERNVSVSNWVYRQTGKKEKVVSVYAGVVLKIGTD